MKDPKKYISLQSRFRFKNTVYFYDKDTPLSPGSPLPSATPTNTPTSTVTPTPTTTPTPTPSSISVDPDAAAYLADVITSGGTLNPTISAATDTLFTSLKSAGLYSKMKVMYPYVGGTASSHSINAKLDKTFDITWYGGMTHGISGSTGNGSNGYGDTNFTTNQFVDGNNSSFGIYVVNGDTNNGIHGGFMGSGTLSIQLGTNRLGDWGWRHGSASFQRTANGGLTDGSFIAIRTGNTEAQLYRNTVNVDTFVSATGSLTSTSLLLFNMVGGSFYTNDTLGFSFFADGLTYAEVPILDGIINTFQTSLGRNTY